MEGEGGGEGGEEREGGRGVPASWYASISVCSSVI